MKSLVGLYACALALSLIAGQAGATIISGNVTSGSGTFVKLTVPFTASTPDNTVGNDNFQNNNLYGFDEGQNILIPTALNVDVLANGSGGGTGAGTLSAGTVVASHYVFFDPATFAHQIGSVAFDSDVLGIITSSANLGASDFLINNGVTYENPTLRGLESGDSATISGLRTISVNWRASSPGDYIRVLTAFSPGASRSIPNPSVIALLGAGLVGFGSLRRKRR